MNPKMSRVCRESRSPELASVTCALAGCSLGIPQAARGCWNASGEAGDVEQHDEHGLSHQLASEIISVHQLELLKKRLRKTVAIVCLCMEFTRRCHGWDWDLDEDKFSFCPEETLLRISLDPSIDCS